MRPLPRRIKRSYLARIISDIRLIQSTKPIVEMYYDQNGSNQYVNDSSVRGIVESQMELRRTMTLEYIREQLLLSALLTKTSYKSPVSTIIGYGKNGPILMYTKGGLIFTHS